MKFNLFNEDIEPLCIYCELGTQTTDENSVMCNKNGKVATNFSCKAFEYAPLKRIPKRSATLPKYDKSEFEI